MSSILDYSPESEILVAFHNSNAVIRAICGPPGCVTGDTIINYHRGKRNSSRPITIAKLFKYMNGGRFTKGETKTHSYQEATGKVYYNTIDSVQESGIKDCYRVTLASGKHVDITAEDELFRKDQGFTKVAELVIGDVLLLKGSMKPVNKGGRKEMANYLCEYGLTYYKSGHRKKNQKYYSMMLPRQSVHRLVVEAQMNKLSYTEYLNALREVPNHGLKHLSKEVHVHHIDHDKLNNSLSNLEVMLKEDHYKEHHDISKKNLNVDYTRHDKITSIQYIGKHMTYDMTMRGPDHNFVVNDSFIKHNSGKSVAWSAEIFYIAMRQEPNVNRERLLKVGIVRKTFRRLSTTTRKTVADWIPDGWGRITQTAPMHGDVTFSHPSGDGTTVKIHYDFMALDTPEDLENLDSYEASVFVWNEASEGEKESMLKMVERIGRFPSPKDGVACTEPCLLVDFNPQSKEHWLYKVFVKGEFKLPKVEGMDEIADANRPVLEYFEQPPAVFCTNFEAADAKREEPNFKINMKADNINNVKPSYYLNQLQVSMAIGAWDKVCTRLMMMWRTVAQGKLIHPQFDGRYHKSKLPLETGDGETVLVGIDTSGIHPAAYVAQSVRGRLQGYLVLYGKEMGLDDFFGKIMIPTIRAKFQNCDILAICDPANARDGRTATSPTSMLKDEYGITAITPGKSNAFNLRKRAVARVLNMMGAFVMDGTVEDTDYIKNQSFMEAIMSTYIHKPIKGVFDSDGNQVYENTPANKNDNSHGIDAFQYLCMHFVSTMADNDLFTGGERKITKKKPRMVRHV